MRFSNLVFASFCLSLGQAHHNHHDGLHRHEMVADMSSKAKKIAVIGAGAGGASAAYHIKKFASSAGVNVNITVFERNPYIGGRSTTVNAWDDPSQPVELGASIFVSVNKVLVDAVKEFNLSTDSKSSDSSADGPQLGVWNGDKFVLTQSAGNKWWNTAKLLWRYGLAPIKTNNLMKKTVGTFLKMYDEKFPWPSLSEVAYDLGLTAVTGSTGEQYLEENGVGNLFAKEVVQASTRVNYAQNIPLIHGLETMVCMATSGAMAVAGGNWQIFNSMIHAATSDVRLSTAVTSIQRKHDGSYCVSAKEVPPKQSTVTAEPDSEIFDAVILAAPYQFADIDFNPKPKHVPDTIDYVQLHVTLFASPRLLSPRAFNLDADATVPKFVLTTLSPHEHLGTSHEGVGKAGFFSISNHGTGKNPSTGQQEFLYKIFSPKRVSGANLSEILGVDVPADTAEDPSKEDVSWIHRKVWNSYPYLPPRVTFEELKLDQGLWYTSGIESFISTMETSGLMGMNVARLVVDEWKARKEEEAEETKPETAAQPEPVRAGERQEVLQPIKAKL